MKKFQNSILLFQPYNQKIIFKSSLFQKLNGKRIYIKKWQILNKIVFLLVNILKRLLNHSSNKKQEIYNIMEEVWLLAQGLQAKLIICKFCMWWNTFLIKRKIDGVELILKVQVAKAMKLIIQILWMILMNPFLLFHLFRLALIQSLNIFPRHPAHHLLFVKTWSLIVNGKIKTK